MISPTLCDCCGKPHDNDDDYCAECYERVWRVGQPIRAAMPRGRSGQPVSADALDALAAYEQPRPTRDPRSVPVLPLAVALLRYRPACAWAIPALEERTARGMERYGDALHTHNGRDAVRDLREEMLDAVQYLVQAATEGALHAKTANVIAAHMIVIIAALGPSAKEPKP